MNKVEKTHPTTTYARFRPSLRRARRPRPIKIGSIAHQIVNQLTVINLTCFTVRKLVKSAQPVSEVDIDRLEKAVVEMHKLIEFLTRPEEGSEIDHATDRRESKPVDRGNVYPIDAAKKLDR